MTNVEQLLNFLGNPCGQTWETKDEINFTDIWYFECKNSYREVPFKHTYEQDDDVKLNTLSQHTVWVFDDLSFIVSFDDICWDYGDDISIANINGLTPTTKWKQENNFTNNGE